MGDVEDKSNLQGNGSQEQRGIREGGERTILNSLDDRQFGLLLGGASISALLPLRVIIDMIVETGLIERGALVNTLRANLRPSNYPEDVAAMLQPVWKELIDHVEQIG